jgi:hypothetical protein
MKVARALVTTAIVISASGVAIHVGALFAGLSWLIFFNAPPSVLASYKSGTLLAPLSCLVIAGLMGTCGYYAASAIGLVRRPPLQSVGLATMSTICIVRFLLLPILAISHAELRNTFEVVAAIVWGIAGAGFASGFILVTEKRKQSIEALLPGDTA